MEQKRRNNKRRSNNIKRKLRKIIRWIDYNLLSIILNGGIIIAMAIAIPTFVTSQRVQAATNIRQPEIYIVEPKPEVMLNNAASSIGNATIPSSVVILGDAPEIIIEDELAAITTVSKVNSEVTEENTEEASQDTEYEASSENTDSEEDYEEEDSNEDNSDYDDSEDSEEEEESVSSNQEACNAYADNLLEEGVITEEEAYMLKQRGNGPENPWIGNVSEEVIKNLADVMYAEAGNLISLEGWSRGKRALLLVGSVVCNRYHYPTLGNCSTLNEIISYRGAYAPRTRRRMGGRYYISEGFPYIEDWARDLYTYGPIGPRTLIWQGPKQGIVYDVIHGEYFGLDSKSPF